MELEEAPALMEVEIQHLEYLEHSEHSVLGAVIGKLEPLLQQVLQHTGLNRMERSY